MALHSGVGHMRTAKPVEVSEVTLTAPPTVAAPLLIPTITSFSAQEGDDVVISVPLAPHSGIPSQVSWTRGDVELVGERFSSFTQRGAVTLNVRNATVGDSGRYALSARNDAGHAHSDLLLEVRTRPGDVPVFLRRLNDLAVKVGTRTRFLVEIRSPTQVKVSWEQEGKPVVESERFHLLHEGNFFCVDVAPVTLGDAGLWICRAHNSNGTATCFCHLNVLVPKAYKAPHFIEELVAILTEQGTVSLECKVVGVPTPTLKWFKDNQEIKAGDVFALSANPQDTTSLGTYTCEAINCMGHAYSTSRVHVLNREGRVQPVESLVPKGPAPVFSKELRNDKAKIGGKLVLSCSVSVPPWPKSITWFNKAGTVESGGRYHVIEDGLGAYSVEVDQVEASDEGEWKCVATSDYGVKGISTCNVSVSYPKNYKKPKFLESLKAILTEEGLVSFECKVVGYPTPQLRWFKDGQELKPGDVYQLTGTNSLGSYCCIAKNCMGETSSTAELTVEDIQSQLNEEERLQLFSKNQPPRFLQGLKSLETKIMEPLKFTVQVSVSPQPSVAWYRDDEEVQESDKYKKEQETKGFCHLTIKRLELVDQAEWKCVATNDYGQSVTSCFLKLAVPRHYKKPRFLENLRAVLSEEGAVNLECKVIGVPQPSLKWYKDGRELKPGDIHRIISGQDGTCCLGTYTCEATNCMGTVSSSASLLGFEDRAQVKPQTEPLRPLPPPAAHLVRHPSLSTIHEERTSQLHDTVASDERAEVSFSFDGKEVSVSLYETPDLTEEEALQVVEMYAEELSEHISEHNVVELPPMRFVKETSQSGNLLMEAVVIDVSPEYYASAEDRTEADLDEFSITEDNGFMSPQVLTPEEMPFEQFTTDFLERTAQLGQKTAPMKPPRKRGADNSESSYHSIKEAKLSPEEESSEFVDALSSIKDKSHKENSSGAKGVIDETGGKPADKMKSELETNRSKDLSVQIKEDKLTENKKSRKKSRSRSRSADVQSAENVLEATSENKLPKRQLKKKKSTDSEKEDDSLREFEQQKSTNVEKDLGKDVGKLQLKIRMKKSKSSESEKEDDSLQEFESRKSFHQTDKECEIKKLKLSRGQLSDSSGREDDSLIEYEKKKESSDATIEKISKSEKQDRQKAPFSKSISTDSSEKDEAFTGYNDQSENLRKRKKRSIKKSSSLEKKNETSDTNVEIPQSSEAESCDRESLINKKVISTSDLDRMRSMSDLDSIGDKSRAQEEEDRSADFDTAEDSAYDKSEMSVLESLTHSVKEIKKGLAAIEEKIISESTDEPQSAKSSLSAIESLVQPINEIQRGLVKVEKQAQEIEAGQYSPSSILETLKEPIQELGRNLAEIEKSKNTESDDTSLLQRTTQTLLETVSHPLQELQKELTFIHQQAIIETGEETYSDVLHSFNPSLLVVQGGVEQTEVDFTSKVEDLTDVTVLPQGTFAQQVEPIPKYIEELRDHEAHNIKERDVFLPSTIQDLEESLAETAASLTTLGTFDLHNELDVLSGKLEKCLLVLNEKAENTNDGEVKDILVSLGQLVMPLKQFKNVIEKCLRLVDENDLSNNPQVRSSNMVLKATLESPVHALGKCINLLEIMSNSKSSKEIRGLGIKTLYKLSFPLEELKTTMKLTENLSEHTSIELLVSPVENLIAAASVINLEASKSGFAENIPEEGGYIVTELHDSVEVLLKSVSLMTKSLSSQNSLYTLSSLLKPLKEFQNSLHLMENKMKTSDRYNAVNTSEVYNLAQELCKPLQAIRTELSIAQHEIELDQYSHLSLISDPIQGDKTEFATNMVYQSLEQLLKSVLTCTEFVMSKSPSETLYVRYLLFALNELILPVNQFNSSISKAEECLVKDIQKTTEPNTGILAVTSSASELLSVLSELRYHSLSAVGLPEIQMIQLLCTLEDPLLKVERGLSKVIEHTPLEDKTALNINMLKTLAEPLKCLQKSLINIYEKLGSESTSQGIILELRHPIQELQRSILIIQDQVSFEYGDEPASMESNINTLQSLINPLMALKKLFTELDKQMIDKTHSTGYLKQNENLHSIIKLSHELQLKLSSIMVEENYINKHSLDSLDMFPIFQDLCSLLRDLENGFRRVDLLCQNEAKPDIIVYDKLCEAVKTIKNKNSEFYDKIMLTSSKVIMDEKHPVHFLKKGCETFITKFSEVAKNLEIHQLDDLSFVSSNLKCYQDLQEHLKNFLEFIKGLEKLSEGPVRDSTSLLSSSDTIKDVNTIMEEVTHTRVSLESLNIDSYKEASVEKAKREIKTFCELLKSVEETINDNTLTKTKSSFDHKSERRNLTSTFSLMIEQLHKIETFINGNHEAVESVKHLQNAINVIQEHLSYEDELSEVYILHKLSAPFKIFKDNVSKALNTMNESEKTSPVSSYLDKFEKSASDLELGLMKLEHALLNSTGDFSSLKNIDIDVIAHPIEELVCYINSIEEKQTFSSESLVEQSSLSMLKTLAQPIREIQEGVLLIQEQVTLESSGKTPSGKSCAGILYEIAKPIRELRSGVALIQEQIVLEPDVETLSDETRATSLQTFAAPIEEMKKALLTITEQQPLIFEPDVQCMSENISLLKTIAQPVKELQKTLASVEINQMMETDVETFSVKENILAIAKPVQTLQESIAWVESQMTLETTGDDISILDSISMLKMIAKPLLEISKGFAVIFEQQYIEEGNVEDVSSLSELSTLANITDVSFADAAVRVGENVTLEREHSIKDNTFVTQMPKITLEENLASCITEQQQVLLDLDTQLKKKTEDLITYENLNPNNLSIVQEINSSVQVQEQELLSYENALSINEEKTLLVAEPAEESHNIAVQGEFQDALVHLDTLSVPNQVEEKAELKDVSLNVAAQIDIQETLSNANPILSNDDLSLTDIVPETLTPCLVQGELQQSLADVESLETEEETLESISIQDTSIVLDLHVNDIQQPLSNVDDLTITENTLCQAEIKASVKEAIQNVTLLTFDKEDSLKSVHGYSEDADISVNTPNFAAETEIQQVISNIGDVQISKHHSEAANVGEISLQCALQVESQQVLSNVETLHDDSVLNNYSQAMALEESHFKDVAVKTQVQEFVSVVEEIEMAKQELQANVTSQPLLNKSLIPEVQQIMQVAEGIISLKEDMKETSEENSNVIVELPDIKEVLSACEKVKCLQETLQDVSKEHPEIEKGVENILLLAQSLEAQKDSIKIRIPSESDITSTLKPNSEVENFGTFVETELKAQEKGLSTVDISLDKGLTTIKPITKESNVTDSKEVLEVQLQKLIVEIENVSHLTENLKAKITHEPALNHAEQQEFKEILDTVNDIKTAKDLLQASANQEGSFKTPSQIETQHLLLVCDNIENLKDAVKAKLSKEVKPNLAIESELQQILLTVDSFETIKHSLTANMREIEAQYDTASEHIHKVLPSNGTYLETNVPHQVEAAKPVEVNDKSSVKSKLSNEPRIQELENSEEKVLHDVASKTVECNESPEQVKEDMEIENKSSKERDNIKTKSSKELESESEDLNDVIACVGPKVKGDVIDEKNVKPIEEQVKKTIKNKDENDRKNTTSKNEDKQVDKIMSLKDLEVTVNESGSVLDADRPSFSELKIITNIEEEKIKVNYTSNIVKLEEVKGGKSEKLNTIDTNENEPKNFDATATEIVEVNKFEEAIVNEHNNKTSTETEAVAKFEIEEEIKYIQISNKHRDSFSDIQSSNNESCANKDNDTMRSIYVTKETENIKQEETDVHAMNEIKEISSVNKDDVKTSKTEHTSNQIRDSKGEDVSKAQECIINEVQEQVNDKKDTNEIKKTGGSDERKIVIKDHSLTQVETNDTKVGNKETKKVCDSDKQDIKEEVPVENKQKGKGKELKHDGKSRRKEQDDVSKQLLLDNSGSTLDSEIMDKEKSMNINVESKSGSVDRDKLSKIDVQRDHQKDNIGTDMDAAITNNKIKNNEEDKNKIEIKVTKTIEKENKEDVKIIDRGKSLEESNEAKPDDKPNFSNNSELLKTDTTEEENKVITTKTQIKITGKSKKSEYKALSEVELVEKSGTTTNKELIDVGEVKEQLNVETQSGLVTEETSNMDDHNEAKISPTKKMTKAKDKIKSNQEEQTNPETKVTKQLVKEKNQDEVKIEESQNSDEDNMGIKHADVEVLNKSELVKEVITEEETSSEIFKDIKIIKESKKGNGEDTTETILVKTLDKNTNKETESDSLVKETDDLKKTIISPDTIMTSKIDEIKTNEEDQTKKYLKTTTKSENELKQAVVKIEESKKSVENNNKIKGDDVKVLKMSESAKKGTNQEDNSSEINEVSKITEESKKGKGEVTSKTTVEKKLDTPTNKETESDLLAKESPDKNRTTNKDEIKSNQDEQKESETIITKKSENEITQAEVKDNIKTKLNDEVSALNKSELLKKGMTEEKNVSDLSKDSKTTEKGEGENTSDTILVNKLDTTGINKVNDTDGQNKYKVSSAANRTKPKDEIKSNQEEPKKPETKITKTPEKDDQKQAEVKIEDSGKSGEENNQTNRKDEVSALKKSDSVKSTKGDKIIGKSKKAQQEATSEMSEKNSARTTPEMKDNNKETDKDLKEKVKIKSGSKEEITKIEIQSNPQKDQISLDTDTKIITEEILSNIEDQGKPDKKVIKMPEENKEKKNSGAEMESSRESVVGDKEIEPSSELSVISKPESTLKSKTKDKNTPEIISDKRQTSRVEFKTLNECPSPEDIKTKKDVYAKVEEEELIYSQEHASKIRSSKKLDKSIYEENMKTNQKKHVTNEKNEESLEKTEFTDEKEETERKLYLDDSSTSDYGSESHSEPLQIRKSQSFSTRHWASNSKTGMEDPTPTVSSKLVRERKYEEYGSTEHEQISYTRRQNTSKPLFCGRLVDRTAAQGSRLKVTCSLTGSPDPTVQWFKDGHLVDTSLDHRYRTRLSNGLASLEIVEAKVGDSGKYTCVARNLHGEASTTANIKVFSYLESAPEAPVFTQHIRDHYKSMSDELVIECRVKGHPLPSVVWTKDGQPLRSVSRYEQSVLTDGTCRLVVHGPETTDSGLYRCEAENTVWSEQTSANITFEGREKYLAESRSLTDLKLPRFTNILSDTTVREGGTVALQVAVKGTPRAEVTWYRGAEPLPKRSSRFRYLEDAGVYSLVMTEASASEAGIYTCRASNAHGHRDTSVNVEIVGTAGGSTLGRGKPAMFITRPDTSMSIAVGEDVSFSFRVSGDPKPRVTWMKGMRDITNNIRTLKETVNDYVRLTLKHATVMDAGTYFLMAKNTYGADHAFVTVRVKQRARSLTPTRASIWSGPDTSTILKDIHESTRALVNDVPGPISSAPVVSDCGKNWLSLSWGKPEHRGAAPVLAYRVEAWLLGTEGGAQWSELGVTPINSFDVFFLKPGSEYQFRITARNRYGWGESVTTTESISVGSVANFPPDIVRDLPGPLKALQGDNVTLECEITGDPPPTIQWLRDGQNVGTLVALKDRVFLTDVQQVHRLIIKQLTEDDSGRYVCEAVNKIGRASTYARLFVVTDPRLLDADRKLKESLAEHQESAPQFTMRLRDRRVQASYPVRLSCQVIGSPTPAITWASRGQPITADDRHQMVQEADHFHTLEICRTLLEDTGEYTVTAQNCLGAVTCHCQLVVDKGIRAYISPEFTSELIPAVTVREEAELRLFAQVEAYPTVSISWQRDGVRLRPSRRLVMTLDPEGRVELALAHLTVRDAGLYTCSAANAVGRSETVCQVFVTGGTSVAATVPKITTSNAPYSKEPRFVTKPRSSEAVEGDTVVITCEVVGDPQPEVMWLRDWLKPGYYRDAPQFRQASGGSQYSLEIPQVKLDFTGTYCVIARNPHGETKAIISLQIFAKGQGKESSMVSGHVKHGQVETLPEIKRELKDLRCCDGDAVTLECLVSATPLPSVRWEKDGKILPLGEDIEAELDGEVARLIIKKVYPEDEGQYSCVAYNNLGRAVTSACLVVDVPEEKDTLLSQQLSRPPGLLSARSTPRSTPRNTPSPARSLSPTPARYREFSSPSFSRPKRVKMSSPKFYTVPHNRIAEEGETVRFQCSVAGHPTPWASWDKDGQIVTPSSRLSVTERDDLRTLELREVTVEDAGLYRVTLENEMGSIEATARLDIIGRQGSRTRSVRAWSAVRSSPTFGRRLIGSAARVGGTFTLNCDVQASPSPVTSWYRNGEMLVKSQHVIPSWDGRRARLELRGLQPEDAGVYTCVAENAVGTTQCSAELRVLQTSDPSDADLQPPVFLQGLPPEQTAAEGQPFELQVRLQGSSPLEVVWVKDGVEVPDCPDLRHVDYGDGRFGLRIADVFLADGGIYNCEAFNDHGDAITSGHLIVNDLSGSEGGSSEPEITFTKTPSPVLARLRGQASFCARLQRRPLSHTSFSWTLNGRSVNNDDRFKVTTEEDCSILHVGEVRSCDMGTVTCTARVCSPGIPPTTVSCDTTLGLDPTLGAPAELLRGPCDTTAMRGDCVLLKATYRGDPEPSVRWLRAGRELSSEGRVQITSRDGVSCLTISAIDADDSGKYVVSVENIHGADCHFASVAVEGPPEAPAARPSVSAAGPGCVTVAWSSPPYDGGCVITGYSVEMRTALSHQWSVVADRCHSLSHVVRGLTPGQTYLFRVRAENIHGASESSAESFPFPLQSPRAGLREEEGEGEGDVETETVEQRLVTPQPGEEFLQRYSVHEELGKGRYGVVHKVTDLLTGHTMAAKFVRCIKKQDREKVQEEIDIMNCLRHPKLLQLAAAFDNPKDMVMVMEYISGGELFERVVADDFTLTERDCILFLRQICEGVRYMHTCHVVHLDLKPENIMCHTRTSHRVKIIDFGLAQRLASNTPVRVLFGTPEFIPPEIINYEPIGVESDMWSVGVICYVLLSGLSPFMGDNDAETFANITRADFDFDDEAFEAISQDAKDFISSLLIKRKEKRLTAEECLKHKWLTQSDTTMSSVKLCTDKLKKFIIRRKWQKTGNAIRALGRMATLSAASRRNSSTSSPPSPRPSLSASRMSSLGEEGGERDRVRGRVCSERSDSGISDCSSINTSATPTTPCHLLSKKYSICEEPETDPSSCRLTEHGVSVNKLCDGVNGKASNVSVAAKKRTTNSLRPDSEPAKAPSPTLQKDAKLFGKSENFQKVFAFWKQ